MFNNPYLDAMSAANPQTEQQALDAFGNPISAAPQFAQAPPPPAPFDPNSQLDPAPYAAQPPANFSAPPITQEKLGFFDRINAKPGGSAALIAMGAGLLSAPDFFSGLGKGAQAYQAVLDKAKDDARPKVAFQADGAYKTVTDPETGATQIVRTPIADYNESIVDKKLRSQLAGIGIREQGSTDRLGRTLDYKVGADQLHSSDFHYGTDSKSADTRYVSDQASRTTIEKAGIDAASRAATSRNTKGPTASITKQVTDLTQIRDGLANSQFALEPIMGAIEQGQLSFGVLSNARQKLALATGVGANEMTPVYSQYQQMLESLRNGILMANRGVQTDGDADRAMRELNNGSGDTNTILHNLDVVKRSLTRRLGQAQTRIDSISNQYDAAAVNPNVPPAPAGGDHKQSMRNKYGLN